MNKKMKKTLGAFCMATGLFVGSMSAAASGYTQSNMPGFPDISCWGLLDFPAVR